MEPNISNIANNFYWQWGSVAVLIWLLVWGLYSSLKRHESKDDIHRLERKEWREQSNKQHEEILNVTKDTHTILTEIKTLLHK